MKLKEIFQIMIDANASDLFVRPGGSIYARILTEVRPIGDQTLTVEEVDGFVKDLLDNFEKEVLARERSCEFTKFCEGIDPRWRFRISVFYQKNHFIIAIRKIDLNILGFEELNLPVSVLESLCREKRGLILLTGITGSGKSTAIASMIEHINKNFGKHILTVEDPIEFIFEDKKAMINQRELGKDVLSYEGALRQAAYHSPDVIYIGNIRDKETCHAALTAAETGALVFSTVHSVNAATTVERLINFFPPEQHGFMFNQLAFLLKGVVSLRLLPRIDIEGLIPAYEVMTLSPSISGFLSKAKMLEISQCIKSSNIFGMNSFNQRLLELVKDGKISPECAIDNSDEKNDFNLMLRREKII